MHRIAELIVVCKYLYLYGRYYWAACSKAKHNYYYLLGYAVMILLPQKRQVVVFPTAPMVRMFDDLRNANISFIVPHFAAEVDHAFTDHTRIYTGN